MDQEVSKTLGELERKLLELERTLQTMSDGEQPAPAEPASSMPASQPETRAEGLRPSGWSRIVDETVEQTQYISVQVESRGVHRLEVELA